MQGLALGKVWVPVGVTFSTHRNQLLAGIVGDAAVTEIIPAIIKAFHPLVSADVVIIPAPTCTSGRSACKLSMLAMVAMKHQQSQGKV